MPPASVYMESQLENATPSTYYKRGGNVKISRKIQVVTTILRLDRSNHGVST